MTGEQSASEGTEFEQHRRYLAAVAYRLLGSLADAEDAVQDAWLRWQAADQSAVRDPRAYLTTIVSRICYDQLGSARARREAYFGEWLPEPQVSHAQVEPGPEDAATLGESVSYAMLAVMEQLGPAERVAFVLHDVFALEFGEIAQALGRSPQAVRQLASRARRRVREDAGPRRVDRAEHRKAVAAFAAATLNGDIPGLMAVLDPDVVWHSDGGGVVRAGRRPVATAQRVSRLVAGIVAKWPGGPRTGLRLREVQVNGQPGLAALDGAGAAVGVIAFVVDGGLITRAYVIVNPEKLSGVANGAVSALPARR
ncbi:RNA polymerase sigma factor SigJ [Actinocrinis puniceicyclus]|uniref:RNA polymerase sigma factor SigJ n=1 Tax=Actinocrinis puniceicyclus TaxID=977794 RepID=A0A8J8BC40_9ACTN|nr:RNA polymerase sigma factor SigJ [Actinocrinis puniceicyclus]MBS2963728.1 RNA polymerase sigma factor SigJ [Actinocrinis puniceicyclus]